MPKWSNSRHSDSITSPRGPISNSFSFPLPPTFYCTISLSTRKCQTLLSPYHRLADRRSTLFRFVESGCARIKKNPVTAPCLLQIVTNGGAKTCVCVFQKVPISICALPTLANLDPTLLFAARGGKMHQPHPPFEENFHMFSISHPTRWK